jgi:hypothetical protein
MVFLMTTSKHVLEELELRLRDGGQKEESP